MANVLPQQAQKKLWRDYRARFLTVLSAVLIALSLAAYLALLPAYLALQVAAPAAPDTPQSGGGPSEATLEVSRAQALILALNPILNATSSETALIQEALSTKPSGVTVDRISYNADDHTIQLSGTGSREKINAYRDAASKNPRYAQVAIPVSALVGGGGNYSMTITLVHQ